MGSAARGRGGRRRSSRGRKRYYRRGSRGRRSFSDEEKNALDVEFYFRNLEFEDVEDCAKLMICQIAHKNATLNNERQEKMTDLENQVRDKIALNEVENKSMYFRLKIAFVLFPSSKISDLSIASILYIT